VPTEQRAIGVAEDRWTRFCNLGMKRLEIDWRGGAVRGVAAVAHKMRKIRRP
jgi:hypothetical protein